MAASSRGASYRPDIDGLRAVAVLLIIMFHLDVQFFSGGFIGADVFFVISGFLITRLIVDEYRSEGGFCLADTRFGTL
jgi:peptidoglycan/LPS O-acetylase OafA/YrhL